MSGCFGNSAEDRARSRELDRHLAKYDEQDRMQERVEEAMCYALTEAVQFISLDQDYEIIDTVQVQRALSNLDVAIYKFNKIFYASGLPDKMRTEIDGIFTALNIMQKNLEKAVTCEIEKEKS